MSPATGCASGAQREREGEREREREREKERKSESVGARAQEGVQHTEAGVVSLQASVDPPFEVVHHYSNTDSENSENEHTGVKTVRATNSSY